MIRYALPVALVLLAGCARSEEARYSQVDNVSTPALNAARQENDDEELAVGSWQNGLQDEQPVLEFGPVGASALFSLSCDSRRNLLLQRHGATLAADLPTMLVTVGSETRRFAVVGTGGAIPMLRGTLAANEPFRPVLIRASTPIVVRIGDAPPLVMPPSPLIGEYAGQCASGEARAAESAGNTVEANATVNVVAGNAAANAN